MNKDYLEKLLNLRKNDECIYIYPKVNISENIYTTQKLSNNEVIDYKVGDNITVEYTLANNSKNTQIINIVGIYNALPFVETGTYSSKQIIIDKLEYPNNVIKLTRNEDRYNLDRWKNEAIQRLIERYPSNYKKMVSYRNWAGAMKYFEDQRKKICNLD